MRLTTTLLTLLGTSHTLVLAQSKNPPCINDCTTKNPVSSQCDGNETGTALDQCRCNTFAGATNMFTCIKACSTADQAVFAGNLPASCRDNLLPGVTPTTTSGGSGGGSTPSSSTGGGQGTAATTSAGGAATKTPNAGVAREAPGFVAVGGLLAAALFL